MKERIDVTGCIIDIEAFINAVKQTSYWIFTESNSLKQMSGKFRQTATYIPSLADRREVRMAVFRIKSEVDQMQQHLDNLTYVLNDLESLEEMEFSDHGEKVGSF